MRRGLLRSGQVVRKLCCWSGGGLAGGWCRARLGGGRSLRAARPGSRLGRAGWGSGSSRPLFGPATPGGAGSSAPRSLARPRLCSSRTAVCRPRRQARRAPPGPGSGRPSQAPPACQGRCCTAGPTPGSSGSAGSSSTSARPWSGRPGAMPAGRRRPRWRQRRPGGRAGAQRGELLAAGACHAAHRPLSNSCRTPPSSSPDPCRCPPDPCRSALTGLAGPAGRPVWHRQVIRRLFVPDAAGRNSRAAVARRARARSGTLGRRLVARSIPVPTR